jgi:hypothetical protein
MMCTVKLMHRQYDHKVLIICPSFLPGLLYLLTQLQRKRGQIQVD